ncbi:PulJ/GspJ family protein [Ottowia sp. VDI28]|uniref:PulJ/GspJ family protein n=1 Tax=Ottowia sp. VDI28 TaxID=3133968 RepID=UPI003C2FD242
MMPKSRGFTLIEVLVALAIMALMALLTWRGIDGMARAQEATRRYTDDVLALQAGLGQWRADLDAMMVWQASNIATTSSSTSAIQPLVNRSLSWDGNTLRITRTAADNAGAGLRVAAWTRRAGTGQWLRWQSPPVLTQQAWQAAWDAAARWGETASLQGTPTGGRRKQSLPLPRTGSCITSAITHGRTLYPAHPKAAMPRPRFLTGYGSSSHWHRDRP